MSKVAQEKWFINKLHDAIQKVGYHKLNIPRAAYSLLIAIAKYADKKGHCWPLQSQLANDCGVLTNHQRRNLKILIERKFITVKRKYERRVKMTRNYYTIHLDAILTISMGIEGDLRVDGIAVNPISTGARTSCSNIEPNTNMVDDRNTNLVFATIKTTHTTKLPSVALKDIVQTEQRLNDFSSNNEPIKLTQEIWFEDFWATYPRKQDKQKARNAWIRKKLDKKIETIKSDLIKRMTTDAQWLSGKEFIPLPSTYLNGERWNDEIIGEEKHDDKARKFTDSQQATIRAREEYLARVNRK